MFQFFAVNSLIQNTFTNQIQGNIISLGDHTAAATDYNSFSQALFRFNGGDRSKILTIVPLDEKARKHDVHARNGLTLIW